MAILDHRLGSPDAFIVGGGCGVGARSPKMSDVNDTNHCPHRSCFVPCVPRRGLSGDQSHQYELESNSTSLVDGNQLPEANMVIIVDGCAHEFKATGPDPDREVAVRDAINDDDLSLQYWRHYNAPRATPELARNENRTRRMRWIDGWLVG